LAGDARKKQAVKKEFDPLVFVSQMKIMLERANSANEIKLIESILNLMPTVSVRFVFCDIDTSQGSNPFSSLGLAARQSMGIGTIPGGITLTGTFAKRDPSPQFSHCIGVLGARWNRKTETGRRTLIDLLLLDALNKDDDNVTQDDFAVFPELTIAPTTLAPNFQAHGDVDYVVAPTGQADFDARVIVLDGGEATPLQVNARTCVIEAKKDQTYKDGTGQALAEMKALWTSLNPKVSIHGILTDSERFKFFILHQNGQRYAMSTDYSFQLQRDTICGILPEFVRGQVPAGMNVTF